MNGYVSDGSHTFAEFRLGVDQNFAAAAPLDSPVFTGTPQAAAGTDYSAARLRNIQILTAEPTELLPSGEFAVVLE